MAFKVKRTLSPAERILGARADANEKTNRILLQDNMRLRSKIEAMLEGKGLLRKLAIQLIRYAEWLEGLR